ncbi:site-specific integrase [Maricaulis maris]|uniref:Site-specific recombinase XerD n=1 Tax=Maricaulis maris TaxID=74318 RepID=A0A495CVY5_9PROT|nr:site-specific integrase [Maricaulis maris]RKQ89523.1 site-specific recombinase XerD [Maricaulis maris]
MWVEVMFLFKRNGQLYFRRRVRDELRSIIGQREWKVSLRLRVGSEVDAIPEINRLTRETDRMIRDAERELASGLSAVEASEAAFEWAKRNEFLKDGLGRRSEPGEWSLFDRELEALINRVLKRAKRNHEEDLTRSDYTQDEWMRLETLRTGDLVEVPCTVDMAAENYRKHHKNGEMKQAERVAVQQWVEFAGDTPLGAIRRKDVRRWITHLANVRGQSYVTIRRRLSSLTAIVNRAIEDLELTHNNPFADQKLPDTTSGGVTDRVPFHTSHLELIERHIRKSAIKMETAVLLRLLRGTTAAPGEISGLEWIDVDLDSDAPHIKIRPNSLRRLKTKSRPRDFPLVGDALAALRSWRGDDKAQSGPVFSERARSVNALSQRLNQVIRAAGVPKSKRLVTYSFRHTFEQAMREAGVGEDLQRYLMGHGERSMTDRYGASKPPMERLQAAVKKALPYLGKVDPGNYQEGELVRGR